MSDPTVVTDPVNITTGEDKFGWYVEVNGQTVDAGLTEGQAHARAAEEAERIVGHIIPKVEHVGTVRSPQPGGEPDCNTEVWATDERVLIHQSHPFPRYTPAEARELADLLVGAARTTERGL